MAAISIPMAKLMHLDAALTAAMDATSRPGSYSWKLHDELTAARAFIRGYFSVQIEVEVVQAKPLAERDFRATLAAWEQAL